MRPTSYDRFPTNRLPGTQNPLQQVHYSHWLQVVARYQTRATRLACHFSFPPTIILESEHGENLSLAETQLFGDGGAVQI